MALVTEALLFFLAKQLYKTEITLSNEMKQSLENADAYGDYRTKEIERIWGEIDRNGIDIKGKVVLDFGCSDGSISRRYLERGAAHVIGSDIDRACIERAKQTHTDPRLGFVRNSIDKIPLRDQSVDVIVSYDVFEHIEKPAEILAELRRVLRPGGVILIGTWSWRHPTAHHLFSVMPVPWAHIFFSERTVLATSERVYNSPWYRPTMHDRKPDGTLKPQYKYRKFSRSWLNQYLIRDFERTFREGGFKVDTRLETFGKTPWAKPLLKTPLREFLSRYVWFVLT
jgi:2-polyprenyl-3-methyl-5-hydroxy-6-metoxy-1,4-benzoquinol methylase